MVYLADVALGDLGRGAGEGNSLVLAGQFVGCVDLLIAGPAEGRLVRAAEQARLHRLAHVALYLHRLDHRNTTNCPPRTRGQLFLK